MESRGNRTILGLSLLVALWVLVYWLWEPRAERGPRVTFAEASERETGEAGLPEEPERAMMPPREDPVVIVQPPEQKDEPAPPPPEEGEQTAGADQPPFRWYTVRSGDTAERIAEREFGSRALWTSIARANPLKDISKLKPGERIKIPLDPKNPQGRPDDANRPPTTPPAAFIEYTVQRGDTLSGIAQRFYGSQRFIDFLYEANRDRLRNKDDLRLGQVLRVPPKPADAP